MSKSNILQVSTSKDYAGLVTPASLTALGVVNPGKMSDVTRKLYRADFQVGTSDVLEQIGATETVPVSDDGWQRWKLQGNSMKVYSLSRATDLSGTAFTAASKPGLAKAEFFMYFNEMAFTDVMLIVGEKGSNYQIRILEDPVQSGTEWRYRVQLFGSDTSKFMPYEQLTAGKQFSVDSAPVERTLSKKGAGFNYTSPIEFKNTFTEIRFQDTVTSSMDGRAMIADVVTEGKKFKIWTDYADWEARKQMKMIYERTLNYSRLNSDDTGRILDNGKSGFKIESGAGLEQQLEMGNKVSFTKPSINVLENIIMDLSDNEVGYGNKRNVVVMTGKYGKMEMEKQIKEKATAFTPLQSDKFITTGKDGGFALDNTFTQYTTAAGDIVTFAVDSGLDDKSDARTTIPMSEAVPGLPGPASSYTYKIMNIGSDSEQNVKLVKVEGSDWDVYYQVGYKSKYAKDFKAAGMQISMPDAACNRHYSAPISMIKIEDVSRTVIMKSYLLD